MNYLAKKLSLLTLIGALVLPSHTCGMDHPIINSMKSSFSSLSSSCTSAWYTGTNNIQGMFTTMDSRTKKEILVGGLCLIPVALGFYWMRKVITRERKEKKQLTDKLDEAETRNTLLNTNLLEAQAVCTTYMKENTRICMESKRNQDSGVDLLMKNFRQKQQINELKQYREQAINLQ